MSLLRGTTQRIEKGGFKMTDFMGMLSWDKGLKAGTRQKIMKNDDVPSPAGIETNLNGGGAFIGATGSVGAPGTFRGKEVLGYHVMFNGQLYNTEELFAEGGRSEERPALPNPPELIAAMFRKYGEQCFLRLNGVYSLALLDPGRRLFFLGTGKLNPQTIYYLYQEECLYFADKIETLVRISGMPPELDHQFLPKYFAHGFVPSPHTLLKGIRKIPTGSFLLFQEGGRLSLQRYWDMQFSGKDVPELREKDYSRNIYKTLIDTTRRRLNIDSRLGVFLSGGLDSGSLVAVLSQLKEGKPLHTFTAIFDEKSFSEANQAKTVAAHFGTKHFEILLTPEKALEFVRRLIGKIDDPFSDDDVICGGVLSPVASEHVDDVFLGDGPDELLMGYPSLLAHKLSRIYEAVPGALRRIFERGMNRLPVSYEYCAFDARFRQFLGGVGYPAELRDAAWWGPFPPQNQPGLFHRDIQENLNFEYRQIYSEALEEIARGNAHGIIEKILTLYIRCLGERWFMKLNAVSQSTSIHFKLPYLDDRFVECANAVPSRYKQKSKYILRKAMETDLPKSILWGRKRPFFVPLALWMKNNFRTLILDVLTETNVLKAGLNYSYVSHMLQQHFSGEANHAKQLWNIFIYVAWAIRLPKWGRD